MLSVYSRHYPPCPSSDLNYKRCRCPKWINGLLGSDGPFIRRSAKTRSWEKAEDFKRKLEEEYEAKAKGLEEAASWPCHRRLRHPRRTTSPSAERPSRAATP